MENIALVWVTNAHRDDVFLLRETSEDGWAWVVGDPQQQPSGPTAEELKRLGMVGLYRYGREKVL